MRSSPDDTADFSTHFYRSSINEQKRIDPLAAIGQGAESLGNITKKRHHITKCDGVFLYGMFM
ncbi:hypothetical protein MKY85_09660 [Paenibacillus sp. FSL R5-0749]|uniref:hypothetical protein n=1 Tax=Paenibacillus sp. FSL R5-0749 TaxID=2921657 RepID=UPI00315A9FFE